MIDRASKYHCHCYKNFFNEAAVPFDKADVVAKGLNQKYFEEMPAYTFGVEFEFLPVENEITENDIIKRLEQQFDLDEDLRKKFERWIKVRRENCFHHWHGQTIDHIDEFDDTYGPLDRDMFIEQIYKPVPEDFDNVAAYKKELDKWQAALHKVMDDYDIWESDLKWSHTTEFFHYTANRPSLWQPYFSEEELRGRDEEISIRDAINFIQQLGEHVENTNSADATTWAVGPDGEKVEIRSRHMQQTTHDFGVIEQVANYAHSQEYDPDSGMHVHVGLPQDFNVYDLLAISTLADEDSIRDEVDDRTFDTYNLLREHLINTVYNSLEFNAMEKRYGDLTKLTPAIAAVPTKQPYKLKLTYDELRKILRPLDRYYGTNLAAFFEHGTVEFRYFGTESAKRLVKWIKYFLLLPRVAKSRNKITLVDRKNKNNRKVVAIRESDGVSFYFYGDASVRSKIPVANVPADQIKQQAQQPKSTVDKLKSKYYDLYDPSVRSRMQR
jgi:hypothetical protein